MSPKITSTGFLVILSIMGVFLLLATVRIQSKYAAKLDEIREDAEEYRNEVRSGLDAIRKKLGIPDNP